MSKQENSTSAANNSIVRIDWRAFIMKCYEVFEMNYQESNSYYFKSSEAAAAKLADVVDYNERQGRKRVNDNSLVEYMHARNRNNYIAVMQEADIDDDEAADLIED